MVKCVFCGRDELSYIGLHLIKNDGTVSYFCSSKCRKNTIKLGRDKRKIKWTEAYREKMKKAAVSYKREEDKKSAVAAQKEENKKVEVKKQVKNK